ncbi:MAG TPA: hypothetical protein P5572_04340 [Phycisphaerae bacterium]|nr:hypothetical protein [Phycisphaerae bacterium]
MLFHRIKFRNRPSGLLPATLLCALAAAGCEDQRGATTRRENPTATPVDATPQSRAIASAVVLEVPEPREVHAGEPFDYPVVATNVTTHPVDHVVIHESAPAGPSAKTAGSAAVRKPDKANTLTPGSDSGLRASRALGRLTPGESKAVTFHGVSRSAGTLHRCLTVDYQPAWCVTLDVVKPRLAIRQNVQQQDGYLCDDLAAVYRVTNPGSGETDPVHLRVHLPEGLAAADGSSASDIELGPIAAGATVEKKIALQPDRSGDFEIFAVARTDELQVESQRQTLHVAKPELALRVDGPKQAYFHRPVQYTVTVENTGDAPARDAAVAVNLPGGAEHIVATNHAYDPQEGIARIGRLDPGASYSFTLTYDALEMGDTVAQFTVGAYCTADATQTLATSVQGIPAVQIEMIDMADPLPVGELTAYEVRVKNEGSAADLGIKLQGKLPENMEFVSGAGATRVAGAGDTVNFGTLEELAPGETATWRVRVRGDEPGQSRFTVQMKTDSTRRPITEQEPTTIVASAAD